MYLTFVFYTLLPIICIAMLAVFIVFQPVQKRIRYIISFSARIGIIYFGPVIFGFLDKLPFAEFHIVYYVCIISCCVSTILLSVMYKKYLSSNTIVDLPEAQRKLLVSVSLTVFFLVFFAGAVPLFVLMHRNFIIAVIGILGLLLGVGMVMILKGSRSRHVLQFLWIPPFMTFVTILMSWEYINYVQQLHP